MITYFYWTVVIAVAFTTIYFFGLRFKNWTAGLAGVLLVIITGWAAYFFYFQQVFVKRWGGVMTISVPEGQQHITATWKDDHLWVENYDPANDVCIFSEYSKGNLLQGKVNIKNCNPIRRQ